MPVTATDATSGDPPSPEPDHANGGKIPALASSQRSPATTATEPAQQPSTSSTHHIDERTSSTQRIPAGMPPPQSPRTGVPTATSRDNDSETLLHTDRTSATPSTQTQASRDSNRQSLFPTAPFRPMTTTGSTGSSGKIIIPPAMRFKPSDPSIKAPVAPQNAEQVHNTIPRPETIRAPTEPLAQQSKSSAQKDQASAIPKPSDSHQATQSTRNPNDLSPIGGVQSTVPPENSSQATSSRAMTSVTQASDPDQTHPDGMNVGPQLQSAGSKMRKSVSANAVPEQKSLRSRQKTPIKGDIVTAKLDGYPPWPAQVSQPFR